MPLHPGFRASVSVPLPPVFRRPFPDDIIIAYIYAILTIFYHGSIRIPDRKSGLRRCRIRFGYIRYLTTMQLYAGREGRIAGYAEKRKC
jgi:hypothetical protein